MTDIYQTAVNAFLAGDFKQAKKICKQIIKSHPSAHPVLHLLAMCEKRQGLFKPAVATFNKALRLAPDTAMYWNNLGETHREMGEQARAIECYRSAIRYRAEYAEAFSNWGAVLIALGEYAEAERRLLHAVEINPGMVNALYNLSVLYINTDSPEKAHQMLERILGMDPNNSDALANLAYLRQQENRFESARDYYLRALAIDPSHSNALLNLASLYFDNRHYRDAAKYFHKVTERNPQDFDAWLGLARSQMKMSYFHDACKAFKRAAAINRQSGKAQLGMADACFNTGDRHEALRLLDRYRDSIGEDASLYQLSARVHLSIGNLEQAEAEARRVLELEPANVFAYKVIVRTGRLSKDGADLSTMRNIYEHAELATNERSIMAFTLARASEMTGDHEAAFGYLVEANKLRSGDASQIIVDRTKHRIAEIKRLFTAEFMENHRRLGCENDVPIFIVGMPRSGKSVTEALLHRHASVAVAGEFAGFINIVRSLLDEQREDSRAAAIAALSGPELCNAGEQYIGELRRIFDTAQHVTNTHPANAFHIGMIRLCLPRAKVVWIDREPRDLCFDIYRKDFDHGHEYSNELRLLGEYAVSFNDLMMYWQQLLPGFIHKVKFEQLITNTQEQMDRLLGFCGLVDDAADKRVPEESGRPEYDALPIPEAVLGIWKPYQRHLSPLFDALEKETN